MSEWHDDIAPILHLKVSAQLLEATQIQKQKNPPVSHSDGIVDWGKRISARDELYSKDVNLPNFTFSVHKWEQHKSQSMIPNSEQFFDSLNPSRRHQLFKRFRQKNTFSNWTFLYL